VWCGGRVCVRPSVCLPACLEQGSILIFIHMWLLPGQTGEAWEPSKLQCCSCNRGTLYGKSLLIFNIIILLSTLCECDFHYYKKPNNAVTKWRHTFHSSVNCCQVTQCAVSVIAYYCDMSGCCTRHAHLRTCPWRSGCVVNWRPSFLLLLQYLCLHLVQHTNTNTNTSWNKPLRNFRLTSCPLLLGSWKPKIWKFIVSGTWHSIVIGQGWTVHCNWHLALYSYWPGVDS
jgi:hypothetical protein